MAYRIEYAEKKNHTNKSSFGVQILMTLMCFFLFLTLVSHFWPQGREVLQLLLIPVESIEIFDASATELECEFDFHKTAARFFDTFPAHETNH